MRAITWSVFAHLAAASALGCGAPRRAEPPPPLVGAAPASAVVGCRSDEVAFPARWGDGTDCAAEPPIQVHAYDDSTFILRQSLCTHFEAPFMYLLLGERRALLEDTGAGGVPIARLVSEIVKTWADARGLADVELVVVNSHAHGDHVAGNQAFARRPATVVVGTTAADVAAFFSIDDWPTGHGAIDLGGRVIDVLPIPGHEDSHIALHDRNTGLLLTGDTLYPGRLYIRDFPAYRASIARLVQFTMSRTICSVLGTHIEMSDQPGRDYPMRARTHPSERRLQLGREHLLELDDVLEAMQSQPERVAREDFVVVPLSGE